MPDLWFLIVVVALAWLFDLYNGMNDAANAIATTVATGALSPQRAVFLARTLNVAGALLTTEVAKTVGKGIIEPDLMSQELIIASLVGAIAWVAFATHNGIPVSITHSLIGGLLGAGIVGVGTSQIKTTGLAKVGLAMVASPILGFSAAFIVLIVLYWVLRNFKPRTVNRALRAGQLVSASFISFTHGSNDTQNAMGIITAALVMTGRLETFAVPLWVIVGSGFFMGLGTHFGGWKVIETVGMKMARLEPIHGFSAEASGGFAILFSTLFGAPISTTHVIGSSIMGAAAGEGISRLRFDWVKRIVAAWLFTFFGAGICALVVYLILSQLI